MSSAVADSTVIGLDVRPVRERPDEFLISHRMSRDGRDRHGRSKDGGVQAARKGRLHACPRTLGDLWVTELHAKDVNKWLFLT